MKYSKKMISKINDEWQASVDYFERSNKGLVTDVEGETSFYTADTIIRIMDRAVDVSEEFNKDDFFYWLLNCAEPNEDEHMWNEWVNSRTYKHLNRVYKISLTEGAK